MHSTNSKGQTYFIGIDGSIAATEAFEVIKRGLLREECDKLVVGHVMNKSKEYLPFNLKPQYLKDVFESKIIELGHKAIYVNQEVDTVRGTKECLWQMATDNNTTIMVTGFNGVKGPKQDPTIAGSNIQFLAINATFPIVIIKDPRLRSVKPDGCYRYAICYDGSDACKRALKLILNMMRPTDKLVALTVKDHGIDHNTTEHEVNQARKEADHTGQFECVIFEKPVADPVFTVVRDYLKNQTTAVHGYVDFVALGNVGKGLNNDKKRLGSLADACLRAKRMNVILQLS